MSFKEWANFGTSKLKDDEPIKDISNDALPIDPINCEIIISELMKLQLGTKLAEQKFDDVVQWGRDFGALKIDISPLGSYKMIIRRKAHDLMGETVWICKKIKPFKENEHNENESTLAEELAEELGEIDVSMVETADADDSNFEKLVLKLKSEVFNNYPKYCMFPKGIKQVNENYFIIYFEARGQGVESPNSRRLEQFQIDILNNKEKGLYRCWGHDLSSAKKYHDWSNQPSEWDEWFSPKQNIKEIVECISTAFLTY